MNDEIFGWLCSICARVEYLPKGASIELMSKAVRIHVAESGHPFQWLLLDGGIDGVVGVVKGHPRTEEYIKKHGIIERE